MYFNIAIIYCCLNWLFDVLIKAIFLIQRFDTLSSKRWIKNVVFFGVAVVVYFMKMLSGSRKYKKYFYYLTCDAVRFVVHIQQCQWSCTIRILSCVWKLLLALTPWLPLRSVYSEISNATTWRVLIWLNTNRTRHMYTPVLKTFLAYAALQLKHYICGDWRACAVIGYIFFLI
jgi:hypothetical protein